MITINRGFGKNLLLKKENIKVDFGLCHAFTIVDTHTYKCHDLKKLSKCFHSWFPRKCGYDIDISIKQSTSQLDQARK